jgi:hypothetical protein
VRAYAATALAGPPTIGFLGDSIGMPHGLTITAALLAPASLAPFRPPPACEEPPPAAQ